MFWMPPERGKDTAERDVCIDKNDLKNIKIF